MYTALNMELDIVRTVLKNEVNEVSVCVDRTRESDVFYTLISIAAGPLRKEIAKRMATTGLFVSSNDFVGSFTHRDSLNLVFHYNRENHFLNKEILYAENFRDRKRIAINFLTAMAETQLDGDIGCLLLTERNLNIGPGGKVYLNYFLDFKELPVELSGEDGGQDSFYLKAAEFAFGILSREYEAKYDGQVRDYPNELRLFHKKMTFKTFHSYSQIMAMIKGMSDVPREQRRGIFRLLDKLLGARSFVAGHTMEVFLTVVVVVTLCYLGYNLAQWVRVTRDTRENTFFVGLREIGEVYLADEEA
ncbi:hypothetical protein LJC63_00770 [Ruminococcaceae bacterium OttesenSCG-928-L11]|nr:hypothetical protein [Ruminococcaceae bacterium OttesenSCG-928-L11]